MATTSRVLVILSTVFGVLALCAVIAGGIVGVHTAVFAHNGVRTEARVVEIIQDQGANIHQRGVANGGTPVWEYVVNGQSHRLYGDDTAPLAHDIGDTQTVIYNPNHPDSAQFAGVGAYILSFILGGIGIVVLAVFVPMFVIGRRGQSRIRRLRTTGSTIWGTVTSMQLNTNVEVNGRSPLRVTATWLDGSGNEHRSTGEALVTNLSIGDRALVRYDPNNPQDSFVDLDANPSS